MALPLVLWWLWWRSSSLPQRWVLPAGSCGGGPVVAQASDCTSRVPWCCRCPVPTVVHLLFRGRRRKKKKNIPNEFRAPVVIDTASAVAIIVVAKSLPFVFKLLLLLLLIQSNCEGRAWNQTTHGPRVSSFTLTRNYVIWLRESLSWVGVRSPDLSLCWYTPDILLVVVHWIFNSPAFHGLPIFTALSNISLQEVKNHNSSAERRTISYY